MLSAIIIWSLRSFVRADTTKIANKLRSLIIIIPIIVAAVFIFLGKFIFSLPFLILILPLLKAKGGLSLFQLFQLWRLLQVLKASGRFRFGESGTAQSSSMPVAEAYIPACSACQSNTNWTYGPVITALPRREQK